MSSGGAHSSGTSLWGCNEQTLAGSQSPWQTMLGDWPWISRLVWITVKLLPPLLTYLWDLVAIIALSLIYQRFGKYSVLIFWTVQASQVLKLWNVAANIYLQLHDRTMSLTWQYSKHQYATPKCVLLKISPSHFCNNINMLKKNQCLTCFLSKIHIVSVGFWKEIQQL